MHYDDLRDYYDQLQWGKHINIFSVLHFFANGKPVSCYELRQSLFFPGSPMADPTASSASSQRTTTQLRLRAIQYHITKARDMGLLRRVPSTVNTVTRYQMTDDGRDFVEQQIDLRLEYLNLNPSHSIAQACTEIEKRRQDKNKHFSKLVEIRRAAPLDLSNANMPAFRLQSAWGISLTAIPCKAVTRHQLATASDYEDVPELEEA